MTMRHTVSRILCIAGAFAIVAALLAACSSSSADTGTDSAVTTPSVQGRQTNTVSPNTATSERYVFLTLDPNFDATYRVTMDLLDGYEPVIDGGPVFGSDPGQGMSVWTVGNVYARPCRSNGTLLDPPIDSSVDALVAGLQSQKGREATAPTDVALDGYAGKYMEMTVPARIDVSKCDGGEYRTWVDTTHDGERSLEAGQRDLLWILDVDGSRLVIDAALGPQTTEKDRADRVQMVESIRIEPV
jgi:hypothetical protein